MTTFLSVVGAITLTVIGFVLILWTFGFIEFGREDVIKNSDD